MFRDRNVARVVAARFISRAGGEAGFFVGVWAKAAYDLDATPTQLALMMLTIGLASMAGSAVSGVLVDRYDPKRVLIAGTNRHSPRSRPRRGSSGRSCTRP